MPHQAAEFGSGPLGQLGRIRFLVLGLLELDFDQFVAFQRTFQGPDHRVGDAAFADVDQGFARVGEATEVSALATGESDRSFVFACYHRTCFLVARWAARACPGTGKSRYAKASHATRLRGPSPVFDMGPGVVSAIEKLLGIMARLRDPEEGCPWDLEQDFASIAPYTVEEAYEVDDAIRRGDMEDLRGELGDLLLQVVYHAQMASEAGHFDFEQVAAGISEKLVRRHPHVFGDGSARSPEDVRAIWEAEKAREREARAARRQESPDLFAGVPAALPALMRAAKLQGRAQDAADAAIPPLADARAASARRLDALPHQPGSDAAEALGELLFASVALARELDVDPEQALRDANARFEARTASAHVEAEE